MTDKKTEALKLALGKVQAARDCHPNARSILLWEAEEILEEALAQSRSDEEQPTQVLEHAPCQGMNFGITRTDQIHSAECQAEHAASIAGGKFIKPAQQRLAEPCQCGKQTVAWCVANTCSKAEQPAQQQELQILRSIMEWQNNTWEQGGALGYLGDGKWAFKSTSLRVTPEELNALFRLAGIEPKQIASKGNCEDCIYSINGTERGYKQPCLSCARPIMSNFVKNRRENRND